MYERLIALALAGGSGTELPASDRIARGHGSQAQDCRASHRKMENVLHESVGRGRKNPTERRDYKSPFLWNTFVLASVGNKSVKHLLTCARPLQMRKSNPVTTEIQPT